MTAPGSSGHEFCGAYIHNSTGCHREPGHPQRHSAKGDTMTCWQAPSGRLHLRKSCSGGTTRAKLVHVTFVEYARGVRCRCIEGLWKADWQRSVMALKLARRKSGI